MEWIFIEVNGSSIPEASRQAFELSHYRTLPATEIMH